MHPESTFLIQCHSSFAGRAVKDLVIYADQSVFEALRCADQPIASSCLGVAVCGRCLVRVRSGADALSDIDPVERKVLLQHGADSDQRLACQTYVHKAGLALSTEYW